MKTIDGLLTRKSVKLSVTITLVTALVLLQPSHMWAQEPTTQSQGNAATNQATALAFPTLVQCTLDKQPLNAIDMNTVSFNSKVKTVHVEKEFFKCLNTSSDQPAIVMVSIYNELFEDVSTGALTKINKVETCAKQLNGTVLGCKMVIPGTILPAITSCTTQPLAFPTRMNTVTSTLSASSTVAETIEAEKEVFACNPSPANNQPTTIEDVVIFTKILEDMNTGKTIATKFVVVTCAKNIATATVACK